MCSVEPKIPYGPNYKSKQGQISEGFYNRLDAPRAITEGVVIFPGGPKYTVKSVGSIKHTWSQEIMANTLSAYIRGSVFLPDATLSWYQSWDNSGKGSLAVRDVSERIY